MLKITGVKLEKISDIDKYLFIVKGLKGRISYIPERYAKANNKYMNDYDPKKPSTFITDLDMNNLYGQAMSEYLYYGGFKWLKNVDGFDVNSVSEKSPIGLFLVISCQIIVKKIADKYEINVGDVKKLIPNLGSKTNSVVHSKNLHLYLSLGMKLTKIHKVLKFKQSDWIKKYIDFNTEKRMNAANDFVKIHSPIILLIKSLVKTIMLFMKLNQF